MNHHSEHAYQNAEQAGDQGRQFVRVQMAEVYTRAGGDVSTTRARGVTTDG